MKKIKKEILQQLQDIENVFTLVGAKMFLMYGTALGAYRDHDFLSWDDDIDIGSFDVWKRDEIAYHMRVLGFRVDDIIGPNNEYIKESQMIHADRYTHVDVFFFEESVDKYVSYRDLPGLPFITIPKVKQKFRKVDLLGTKFNLLAPPEQLLKLWYGDWKDKTNKKRGELYVG